MPSLKAIRKRISSVNSTQQITKAMKMVAAAKLRRAQTAAVAARPYAERLEVMVGHLLHRLPDDAHPLLRIPEQTTRTYAIVVTGDRGLCGGYNTNLNRMTEGFLRDAGADVRLAVVGRKGLEHLRRRRIAVAEQAPMPTAPAAVDLAHKLGTVAQELFITDAVDRVMLIYTQFHSALSQVPVVEQLLPFPRNELDADAPAIDYLFEPGPAEILGHLLPRRLEVRILHALLEAGASEQAARMTAMDSATRNASEMIARLTLEMNRARQAAITKELMEIISGAEALKG